MEVWAAGQSNTKHHIKIIVYDQPLNGHHKKQKTKNKKQKQKTTQHTSP